jgi:DNA polymerase alpha subunit A
MLLRAVKRTKLQKLVEARQAGSSLANYDNDEVEDQTIYDEVDEETYREHKRKQLMNDDFIVDDGGEGYVDNGVDEWDDATRPQYYSDEEDDDIVSKKRKRNDKRPKKLATTAQISSFFKPTAGTAVGTKVEADIDDILQDFSDEPVIKNTTNIFNNSSNNSTKKKQKPNKFNFSIVNKPNKVKHENFDDDLDNSMHVEEPISSPVKILKENTSKESTVEFIEDQSSTKKEKIEESDDSEDEIIVARKPRVTTGVRPTVSNYSSVKPQNNQPSSPLTSQSQTANYTAKLDKDIIVETDSNNDSFKMFWLDYCEVDQSLILFGKILTRENKLVSGMVQVNGLNRELYFLPRKYRKVDGEEVTDDAVAAMDVYEEIVPILMEQYGLDSIKAKPETMKYAFELPEVPKEGEYLKLLLPFKTPKNKFLIMPSELEGETFSRVFGTNSNLFEAFVLQRNISGPCWLEISNGNFSAIQNTSHCQVEVSINSPAFIKTITDKAPAPPNLTISSISVQTKLNVKQNKQEVVAVSIATFRDVPQDAPIEEDRRPNDIITLIRPVGSVSFPPGLQQLAQKQGFQLKTLPNEKVLLNFLSALIKNQDPDVFVGHRLENISLDVLVHRMHDLNVTTWSTFGRRNRKQWPERFGRGSTGFNNNLQIREIFQGRLLCDIANEMGQSLTMKCQSWDLHEMYEVVCKKLYTPIEINYQNPRYAEDTDLIMMALKDLEKSVKITAEIAYTIQILSLSKQLTNIAGNAWSHTLSGTRAGRNEYILLHEFRRNGFIVPDKEDKYHKNTSQQQEAKLESVDDDATTATSNKKPKYQGGLVFEPEKGLHKNYILVMDFNSLYPSIIQEFNICFTTVERDAFNITHDEERDLPAYPDKLSDQGVLPRLLNNLVSRRREVKKLLKDPQNTNFQKAQYDIKQQALKLTANSMYGCLGYVNSRFYAKPLAMLVTNKGREILMDTRQLAESIGLRVVYGDTDSVMIDTGTDDFKTAIKVGEEFKVQVNERYRLLEIDIDNVFKRLLLHAKKKYAAMNSTIDRTTGEEITTLEVKGLDMRRREYCQLSKDISTFVLTKILSDLDPENTLSEIYDYLEDMKQKILNNEIDISKFRINTKLSKDPTKYPNAKSMPQVQVALRLRKEGKVIKAGSVITFVITAPTNDEEKSSPAERARAIQEVLNKSNTLKPDASYYLDKQIFAPVERLLERVEGIDLTRVANCLGIDTKKYILKARNSELNGEITPLEANISDSERFRQCSYLVLNCNCGNTFRFGGIQASNEYKVCYNGLNCGKCEYSFPTLRLTSQLEYTIRKHISLYYAGWLVCDDSSCGIRTRQISVYGKRCIGSSGTAHGCKGMMRYQYSDKAIYNQLLYFQSIFDVTKAKKNELKPIYDDFHQLNTPNKLPSGQVDALAEQNKELFSYCQEVVEKYLSDCGRRYVNMGSIFEFMNHGS